MKCLPTHNSLPCRAVSSFAFYFCFPFPGAFINACSHTCPYSTHPHACLFCILQVAFCTLPCFFFMSSVAHHPNPQPNSALVLQLKPLSLLPAIGVHRDTCNFQSIARCGELSCTLVPPPLPRKMKKCIFECEFQFGRSGVECCVLLVWNIAIFATLLNARVVLITNDLPTSKFERGNCSELDLC